MTDTSVRPTGIPYISTIGTQDGVTVVRFGVRASLSGDPVFLRLADRSMEGQPPRYELHWFADGFGNIYECTDAGYNDVDNYRVFIVPATFDDSVVPARAAAYVNLSRPFEQFMLFVGPDYDPRMRVVEAGETSVVDDIAFEHLSVRSIGAAFAITEETKPVLAIHVDKLVRTINRFIGTNGHADFYDRLGVQLAKIMERDTADARTAIDMPLWLIAWLQRLLTLCSEPRGPLHLHSPSLNRRVGVPMQKILGIINRLRAEASG